MSVWLNKHIGCVCAAMLTCCSSHRAVRMTVRVLQGFLQEPACQPFCCFSSATSSRGLLSCRKADRVCREQSEASEELKVGNS